MASANIWELKKGDKFRVKEGQTLCTVVTPTEDGKGLVAAYLEGDLKGQQDFVFDEEVDYASIVKK